MIVFDLKCGNGHVFESWFKDGATFERQHKRGHMACTICGSLEVAKAVMAPRISSAKDAVPPREQGGTPGESPVGVANHPAAPRAVALARELAELRRRVEENCEPVGDRFAEEARKMHYGEAEKRGIYGEASDRQAYELTEEGIEFSRVPWPPRRDS
ncbi:MAG: DUF1178 family protein [Pseudomonadota bacterium]